MTTTCPVLTNTKCHLFQIVFSANTTGMTTGDIAIDDVLVTEGHCLYTDREYQVIGGPVKLYLRFWGKWWLNW